MAFLITDEARLRVVLNFHHAKLIFEAYSRGTHMKMLLTVEEAETLLKMLGDELEKIRGEQK